MENRKLGHKLAFIDICHRRLNVLKEMERELAVEEVVGAELAAGGGQAEGDKVQGLA